MLLKMCDLGSILSESEGWIIKYLKERREMRMKRKLFDRITVNPKVCMGQPTIRGMRITVAFVLKLLASGMSHEEVMKAYPELEEKDILQAIEYASWLAGEYYFHLPVSIE